MKRKTKYRRMKKVVIYLQGGAIQGASDVPPGLEVEVRDYDISRDDPGVKYDKDDGDYYLPLVFGGTMVPACDRETYNRRRRLRATAPMLHSACRKLHDALSGFLEAPDICTVDRQAAKEAIAASFKALATAEGHVWR